jgi:hypothetical protein
VRDNLSKPDPYFAEARDLLRQDRASFSVEQQLGWSMDLQRVAITLLEKTDVPVWGRQQSNLDSAAEMARALSKIYLADHLVRLVAAGVAVNAKPGSEQESEMVALFDSLSSPAQLLDADRQRIVAQDCVSALSNVYAYHNKKTKDPSRAKIPQFGDHGYNLRTVAMARLFQGALLADPENLIESYAIIAECSPLDSSERLAAVLGLLRYPEYANFLDGSDAEGYIENLAPIGSVIRHEVEELLKTDATCPLKTLLEHAREKRKELKRQEPS